MDVETATVQTLAREAAGWFESAYRGDTGEDQDRYTRCRDGAPEWVGELVRAAHGDMFPDDWRYDAIASALEFVAEVDDPDDGCGEFADQTVDVYNGDRIAWLGSHGARQGYCDEAAAEFGAEDTASDIISMIGWGQYAEASEVYGLVLQALEARLGEVDEG